MQFEFCTDATQRQVVTDIAHVIYKSQGYAAPRDLDYFFKSKHPQERAVLAAAEAIYELFVGDSPSYDDDPEE